MRAMILAAGLGTRLRPLTDSVPKALVPVAGRPLVEYSLLWLRSQGIQDVVMNLHHHGEKIRAALGDGSVYGLRITYSSEDPILDTGGGIKKAQPFLDGETFLVLNCDTILDLDLSILLDTHRRNQAVATLVLRADPEARRYGIIETDRRGRVRRFLGQPPEVNATLSPFMFTGLQILEPRVFDFMPAHKAFGTTRETYPQLLQAGEPLYGFIHSGPWMVVDDAEGMARATRAIISGRVRLSYLRP
jgi:NDP-sugar pyrophosphorylase family protein